MASFSPDRQTRENLFQRFREGDMQAFDQLFRDYYPALVFFARRIAPVSSMAEEIVQDVMLKLWLRREEMDSPQAVKAFLYISTKHACLDSLTKEQRKQQRDHRWYEQEGALAPDIEEKVIFAEVLLEVSRALDKLPEQCRKIMQLSYLEGLSGKEIAEKLDVSVSTVNNQKARGLILLRRLLNPGHLALLIALLKQH